LRFCGKAGNQEQSSRCNENEAFPHKPLPCISARG
jgi:hypothetical protein